MSKLTFTVTSNEPSPEAMEAFNTLLNEFAQEEKGESKCIQQPKD